MTASTPSTPAAAPLYPTGTVHALLASEAVTAATRRAVALRLAEDSTLGPPRFFDAGAIATLRAVCARLIAQPDHAHPVDVAAAIDDRLARRIGDGWRYATMPPDEEAYRRGLLGVDAVASAEFGAAFAGLDGARQDAVLGAIQRGEVEGGVWDTMPARRFFEDLLAEVVEVYYSHPVAQEEIGYAGMADAPGWQAIGLNELEAREPRPIALGGQP